MSHSQAMYSDKMGVHDTLLSSQLHFLSQQVTQNFTWFKLDWLLILFCFVWDFHTHQTLWEYTDQIPYRCIA